MERELMELKSKGFSRLFPGFFFFLRSLTRCLPPAPLKLRPYGAIQIYLLLLLLIERRVGRATSVELKRLETLLSI